MESGSANATVVTNSFIKKEVYIHTCKYKHHKYIFECCIIQIGIMVKCSDTENNDTYFRCILVEDEFLKFSEALQSVSHEYDAKDTINILHHAEEIKGNFFTFSLSRIILPLHTPSTRNRKEGRCGGFGLEIVISSS